MTTYTSLTCHVIFSTKYRIPSIDADLRNELYPYIGGIIRGEKGQLLEIDGHPITYTFLRDSTQL